MWSASYHVSGSQPLHLISAISAFGFSLISQFNRSSRAVAHSLATVMNLATD
jgi:hypothetical protein